MALQEAKPQGPSEAEPAAREPRDRLREQGLCGAGGIAARCQGVRSSEARRSEDVLLRRPLLLGLLLLAALSGHCWADSGTDNLQIHVTPTSESFPLGKLLPISPTWPFLEVKSSSAADRFKNVLGQPPDNTTLLKLSQTPLPKAHRRTRAHVDFSSSPYQGSGHSASLDLAKDPTETLVQTRPEGGREAADMSVETSVSSKGELSATAAATATTTLFLRRSSPAPLSAALTAKGTGSSSSNLAKSSLTTALAKNVTNKAASGPKVTAGTIHTAFPFTPTYMLARTAHSLSTHTAMQGATGSVSGLLSTTHLPKKPQAMYGVSGTIWCVLGNMVLPHLHP